MTKWEYVVEGSGSGSELQNKLNTLTKEGLELVTLYLQGSRVWIVFRKEKKE